MAKAKTNTINLSITERGEFLEKSTDDALRRLSEKFKQKLIMYGLIEWGPEFTKEQQAEAFKGIKADLIQQSKDLTQMIRSLTQEELRKDKLYEILNSIGRADSRYREFYSTKLKLTDRGKAYIEKLKTEQASYTV